MAFLLNQRYQSVYFLLRPLLGHAEADIPFLSLECGKVSAFEEPALQFVHRDKGFQHEFLEERPVEHFLELAGGKESVVEGMGAPLGRRGDLLQAFGAHKRRIDSHT